MWKRISLVDLSHIDARNICIIKPSALGDVVQTLPLLAPLKTRFPSAKLSWVINRGLAGLLEGHPHIDQLIPFDRHGGLRDWARLLTELRRSQFDLVLDLQGLLRTGIMSLATRSPLRIGLETAREGSQYACHVTLPDTGRLTPAHARYWRVAEVLGVGDRERRLQLNLPQHVQDAAAQLLVGLPRPLVAVHAGARWETKRWPAEKFAAVAESLMRESGVGVVLLGSRDESQLAAQVVEAMRASEADRDLPVRNLAGRTSLKQLAAVLQSADLVLSCDSGPMHLAAELGTPVVGVFTCTDPHRSGPPGAQHRLIATSLPCGGSYCKTCPHSGVDHLACFGELPTARVLEAAQELLERRLLEARTAG